MAKKRNPRVRKSSTKGWGVRGVSKAIPATVLVPSGRCPYIVESTDRGSLEEWIWNVTEEKPSVVTYDRSVYIYWLRHSFYINGEEYREAKSVVESLLPDQVKSVRDLGFSCG